MRVESVERERISLLIARTFRRVDKLDEPLPPSHPEFGPAPVVGPCDGGSSKKVGGGGGSAVKVGGGGEGGVEDMENFLGKKKKMGKKRRSR